MFLLFRYKCGAFIPNLCLQFWNCILVPGTFHTPERLCSKWSAQAKVRVRGSFLGGFFLLQFSENQDFSPRFSLMSFTLQSEQTFCCLFFSPPLLTSLAMFVKYVSRHKLWSLTAKCRQHIRRAHYSVLYFIFHRTKTTHHCSILHMPGSYWDRSLGLR